MNERIIDLTLGDLKKVIEEIVEAAINKPKEYYTIKEVQDLLKIKQATVYNYCNAGKLHKLHIGGRVLFKADEVNNAIKSGNVARYSHAVM